MHLFWLEHNSKDGWRVRYRPTGEKAVLGFDTPTKEQIRKAERDLAFVEIEQ